jgi:hypothetical protein
MNLSSTRLHPYRRTLALLLSFGLWAVGCGEVPLPLPGYSCHDDNDCLSNYHCQQTLFGQGECVERAPSHSAQEHETETSIGTGGESGTETDTQTDINGALDCDTIPHGQGETRIRYNQTIAPSGNDCVGEAQTRTCSNGNFSLWSGTYTETSCTAGYSQL